MADENKPAFYPRVGNIKAKNFKPAQPMPFVYDERAMELPDYKEFIPKLGTVDLSVPSKENRELNRRITERDADLMRQVQADRSPLEKLAGGLQAGRFLGSAMTQGINAIPTQLFSEGTKAEREAKAEKFIQDRLYKPEQPVAYEYAQDAMDFLDKLETEYKIPPLLPEALPLQYLSGPATSQAMRTAGRGAEQAGRAIERRMEPVVKGAFERGGLPREMVMAMGANTQSNVVKPYGGNWLGGGEQLGIPENDLRRLKRNTAGGNDPADMLRQMHERYPPEEIEKLHEGARRGIADNFVQLEKDVAINKWIDSNLKNYVKKEMATRDDPVRKLAEEGIIHTPLRDDLDRVGYLEATRKAEGYPAEGMGKSELAKRWENLADDSIRITKAGKIQEAADVSERVAQARAEVDAYKQKLDQDFLARMSDHTGNKIFSPKEAEMLLNMPEIQKAEILGDTKYKELKENLYQLMAREQGFEKRAGELNPFVAKLDPETRLYSGSTYNLGFDHIVDVLREDITTGRIRPDQLNKVSMEQAVRRTYEYDQEMAKRMREAAIKQTEGFPTYKEYPEGFRWIEIAPPKELPQGYSAILDDVTSSYKVVDENGKEAFPRKPNDLGHINVPYFKTAEEAIADALQRDPRLENALKYEGDTMGHCVGGYCKDVRDGNTKIYSLRDARGEPHVTVEVRPSKYALRWDVVKEYIPAATEEAKKLPNGYTDLDISDIAMRMAKENEPEHIIQIKGKGNAKPKDDYLPFVQDFVKSGNWGQVGDMRNTGLRLSEDAIGAEAMQALKAQGVEIPKYVTQEEAIKMSADAMSRAGKNQPPAAGMKRGGKVSISNNPDTMMLELNNQKMKNGEPAYAGGKVVIKQSLKAAKPPKIEVPIRFPVSRGPSVPEIRAMAERMAPQVMGEFVRAAPTPSKPNPSESVVGKSRKQFEREKTLPIEYENIKEPVTPEEFDYAKKKGALLIGAQGDVTPGNRMLISIDNQPLSAPVHMQAGPEWELYNPTAWAATDQMAKTYMKRAKKAAEEYEADPYLHYHKMTPDANWYAMHHFNSILGHLRPEELKLRDPKLYQEMLEEIRTKDVGFGKHPEFEGFDDPLNLQIHAQMDPNFRRHIGAIFGGPKFTTRYGLNSGQDVLAATSLPELRDLEAGASGYAVVPLDVNAPLRNFEADSQTYDTGFPKAGASGRSKYPSPYQLIYRDTLNWMKDVPSDKKSSEFGRMNMIVPKQQIDNELIEAIGEYQRRMKELTGKKKGGAVKKAEGGYLKKPAAYINGDEFVNAAKKYGIKDSMNNLNKIVDLVNKGLSVDDAARQVADTGMHKAAGGAIRGDDLILEERPL